MVSSYHYRGFTYMKNIDLITREFNPDYIQKLIQDDFVCDRHGTFAIRKSKKTADIHKKIDFLQEGTFLAHPHTDITKCFTAFGRLAIPKLRKELLHHDLLISRQAIVTLLDLVHDPEKAIECVRLNVLARLVRLMLSEDVYSRQHTHCVLKVIASQPCGPEAIVDKQYIIKNLKITVMDKDPMTRLQAAMTCMYLSRSWTSCSCLIKEDYVDIIIEVVSTEELPSVLIILLTALQNLLEKSAVGIHNAVENRVCEILTKKLKHKCSKVRSAAIAVLAQAFVSKEGKVAGELCANLLESLIGCLEDKDEDVIQQAATALAFLFVTTPCKLRGSLDALSKLLPLALCSNNLGIAVSAVQAITNLAAYPLVKDELKTNYLGHISRINTQNDSQLIECKSRLIEVVTHEV